MRYVVSKTFGTIIFISFFASRLSARRRASSNFSIGHRSTNVSCSIRRCVADLFIVLMAACHHCFIVSISVFTIKLDITLSSLECTLCLSDRGKRISSLRKFLSGSSSVSIFATHLSSFSLCFCCSTAPHFTAFSFVCTISSIALGRCSKTFSCIFSPDIFPSVIFLKPVNFPKNNSASPSQTSPYPRPT